MGDEQQVGAHALDRRVVPAHPAAAACGPRSSNGSMKTVVSPSVRRNADCPYHSSCMPLLRDEDGGAGTRAAAHGRRRRRDEARDDGERERDVQAVAERRRRSASGRTSGRSGRPVVRRQRARACAGRAGAGSGCSRGTRRTGSRPAAAGATAMRRAAGTPWLSRPALERVRERRRQADDHQREEDPDREHLRGVLERLVHRAADAAIPRRQAVHHRGAVGRRRTSPSRSRSAAGRRRTGVGEVGRQQREQHEAERGSTIPAVANGRAPKRSDR